MGAITAATLATIQGAAAIGSAAASLGSAGASFAQAAKQKRQMREAEEAAAKYMDDARKKFSVNFAEQLQVPLEGYEMASDLNREAVAQNIEALKESGQRAVLGGVAGLQQQAQTGAEQLRMAMQQDLYDRDKAIAAEESRLRDIQGEIDLGEAAGAQQAAADAQALRAQSVESAFGGLQGAMSTIYEAADLYGGDLSDKVLKKYGAGLTPAEMSVVGSRLQGMDQNMLKDLYKNAPQGFNLTADFGVAPSVNIGPSRTYGVRAPKKTPSLPKVPLILPGR
jgi:hypothetical protein